MTMLTTLRRVCRTLALAAATTALAAPAATAQEPGAFDCLTPTIFVAQGVPTQLSALTYGTGSSTFTPIGPPANEAYNSIAFNPGDGFIYGMARDGRLLRIDSSGGLTSLGNTGRPSTNNGAFDEESGELYVGSSNTAVLFKIDVKTRVSQPILLSGVMNASDLTFIDGFLWGKMNHQPLLTRIDPRTGEVVNFNVDEVPGSVAAGAAWTYGNGNLGLSDNTTGTIYQLEITDAGSATPDFRLVASSPGPASGNNDGTSCKGRPVDLSIAKSGEHDVFVGQGLQWELAVHNHGEGISSGYTVTDEVPAQFTNVSTPTPGCSVEGNTVTCTHGPQEPGETAVFTIEAIASSPGTATNTGHVTGNEEDPNAANDSSSWTTAVRELHSWCRGTPISVLGQFPATANLPETPCRSESHSIARVYRGDFGSTVALRANLVDGLTVKGESTAFAAADVAEATLTAPGLALMAKALHSEVHAFSTSACSSRKLSSGSSVGTLVVNGVTHVVGAEPRAIPVGAVTVYVNQTTSDGNTVTRRALFVDLPGSLADVAIGESKAGRGCHD